MNHLVMGSLVDLSSHEACVTVSINHRNKIFVIIFTRMILGTKMADKLELDSSCWYSNIFNSCINNPV